MTPIHKHAVLRPRFRLSDSIHRLFILVTEFCFGYSRIEISSHSIIAEGQWRHGGAWIRDLSTGEFLGRRETVMRNRLLLCQVSLETAYLRDCNLEIMAGGNWVGTKRIQGLKVRKGQVLA